MPSLIHRDIPEPRPGERHDTSSSQTLVFLLTVLAMTLLFLIWRRSDQLKSVVQHRLKRFTSPGGAIQLPAEDGPPAETFNEDEDLDAEDEPPTDRRHEVECSIQTPTEQPPST